MSTSLLPSLVNLGGVSGPVIHRFDPKFGPDRPRLQVFSK